MKHCIDCKHQFGSIFYSNIRERILCCSEPISTSVYKKEIDPITKEGPHWNEDGVLMHLYGYNQVWTIPCRTLNSKGDCPYFSMPTRWQKFKRFFS